MLDFGMGQDAEKVNLRIRDAMAEAMQKQGITAADLSRRLGKTRSYGYQLTGGGRAKVPDSLVAALDALDLEIVVRPKQ